MKHVLESKLTNKQIRAEVTNIARIDDVNASDVLSQYFELKKICEQGLDESVVFPAEDILNHLRRLYRGTLYTIKESREPDEVDDWRPGY